MAKREIRGNVAAPDVQKHPAAAAVGLATAVTLGFGTTVLLIAIKERTMRRIARRIVPPEPAIALRNHLSWSRRKPTPGSMLAVGIASSAGIAGAFALLHSIFDHGRTERFDHHLHNLFRK